MYKEYILLFDLDFHVGAAHNALRPGYKALIKAQDDMQAVNAAAAGVTVAAAVAAAERQANAARAAAKAQAVAAETSATRGVQSVCYMACPFCVFHVIFPSLL